MTQPWQRLLAYLFVLPQPSPQPPQQPSSFMFGGKFGGFDNQQPPSGAESSRRGPIVPARQWAQLLGPRWAELAAGQQRAVTAVSIVDHLVMLLAR